MDLKRLLMDLKRPHMDLKSPHMEYNIFPSYQGCLTPIFGHGQIMLMRFNIFSKLFLLRQLFATKSFLNCSILILDIIRDPETNFQAWSKNVDEVQHFSQLLGLLKQICCHPKFLKLSIPYSPHIKGASHQFLDMVKKVV